MLAQESILRQIESAGYRVTGCRDVIGDGRDGPLVVTAENSETGERHTVMALAKGSDGEIEAVRKLAVKAGIQLDDDK